jgi:hypothetical protein
MMNPDNQMKTNQSRINLEFIDTGIIDQPGFASETAANSNWRMTRDSYAEGVGEFQPRVTPWDKELLRKESNTEGVGDMRKTPSGLDDRRGSPNPGFYPGLELANTFGVKKLILAFIAFFLLVSYASANAVSNEGEVRATVDKVFQNLKSKNYEALYDSLPANTRARITRERFASSLRRTQDNYALDRMDVGKIKVLGNIAVVDTDLYGRLLKPFDMEGKIVVQQYLVREEGKWKVATGDNATIQRFLKSNPAFARQFKIRLPRIFVKKDGRWVEFVPPQRSRQ